MRSLRYAVAVVVIFASVFVSLDCRAQSACPTPKQVAAAMTQVFHKDFDVVNVAQSPVPGVCQAQVDMNGQKRLIYTDAKGEYLIPGQIFRVADRSNITADAIAQMNRFTKEELAEVDKLVAFTLGDKGKTFYLVTDPQCPYCKQAEAILEPMAKAGEIQVKVLLFPLRFHKGAKEEAISIICDKKGYEGLKGQYKSDNQCEAGTKKVDETVSFLQKKGITGTPTYIFSDGLYQSGVIPADALKKRLGE